MSRGLTVFGGLKRRGSPQFVSSAARDTRRKEKRFDRQAGICLDEALGHIGRWTPAIGSELVQVLPIDARPLVHTVEHSRALTFH